MCVQRLRQAELASVKCLQRSWMSRMRWAFRRSDSDTSGCAAVTVLTDSGVLFEIDVVHFTGVPAEDLDAALVRDASGAAEDHPLGGCST